jgi:uncharacterized protein (DUF427 family)
MPDSPRADYPRMLATTDQIEPAPRRVRGLLAGQVVFDTQRAVYVWEWPNYPQYYIPVDDVRPGFLVDENRVQQLKRGSARRHGLVAGTVSRPGSARLYTSEPLAGMIRFDWDALDAWFEEDEQIFVHPRNPYVRVDAIRSTRAVRIELEGEVLAESGSPVMVFETGLPTRYYFNRTEVHFSHLQASDTVTRCPYKGTTTGYWSVRIGDGLHTDLAWSYDFPTAALLPIAGLVSFYNEKVDIWVDDIAIERPVTHFFT